MASFSYARGRRPASVSLLSADGRAALTVRLGRDGHGDVVSADDGRGRAEVSYSRSGYPVSLSHPLRGRVSICYNAHNLPVSMTGADGIVTKYTYSDFGAVTRIERLDGSEALSSLSVSYDGAGRPVSYADQDGLSRSFGRDAFGRVLKERFPDGSECAYSYDALGRRTSVVDENGHEIRFGWGRFGLESRTTAAGQVTDYVRDDLGLVKEVVSKWNGSEDRRIQSEYDEFGRLVYADYGNGEIERFAYDKWNRLAKHTRGKTEETYKYDHFGRLAEKRGGGLTTAYSYDNYGNRLSRVTKNRRGEVVSSERRRYDAYGRLVETSAGFGSRVTYAYDSKGRLARQTIDGTPIDYVYTKYGQLAGKYLGGKLNADASVTYEYSKSGQIVARTANGVRQTYEYDRKGQLLAVKDADGNAVERYAYDKAGNMLKKTVNGKTTTFAFDAANQLVSSTAGGITTRYAYDAAGRLVREGSKTYRYGWLDKVTAVVDGDAMSTYEYHADGQLARATYAPGHSPASETFEWDGLALVRRGDEQFVNEPHVGGGNPVASSKGTSFFNDMLGTTVGSKSKGKYSAAALTAFGENLSVDSPTPTQNSNFFTGKPYVEGLGHAFLMRNYRAGLAKWQTADPLGYPDGWNALAYCNNGVTGAVDLWGGATVVSTVTEGGTPSDPNYGGETSWNYRIIKINPVTHSISVEVLVQISFSNNLKDSKDFSRGDIATYTPHDGPPGGELTPKHSVREAAVAHEYGHSDYVTGNICSSLQFALGLLEGRWSVDPSMSENQVRSRVHEICTMEKTNSLVDFCNAANDPTIEWFQSSPEWKLVHDDKSHGYWEWVKE